MLLLGLTLFFVCVGVVSNSILASVFIVSIALMVFGLAGAICELSMSDFANYLLYPFYKKDIDI